MATIEAAVVLALCLISDAVASKQFQLSKTERVHELKPALRQQSLKAISQSIEMLDLIAQRSVLAQKGILVLRRLRPIVEMDEQLEEPIENDDTQPSPKPAGVQGILDTSVVQQASSDSALEEQFMSNQYSVILGEWPQDAVVWGEWVQDTDMSRFFQDDFFSGEFGSL
jgi:hypothetical protein